MAFLRRKHQFVLRRGFMQQFTSLNQSNNVNVNSCFLTMENILFCCSLNGYWYHWWKHKVTSKFKVEKYLTSFLQTDWKLEKWIWQPSLLWPILQDQWKSFLELPWSATDSVNWNALCTKFLNVHWVQIDFHRLSCLLQWISFGCLHKYLKNIARKYT